MNLCKFCNSNLLESIIDLGFQPPCNQIIPFNSTDFYEKYFPLELFICKECSLVQVVHDIAPRELFSKYSYFSSYSSSWLEHAKEFSLGMIDSLDLTSESFVVEIASNDGYLLRNFKNAEIPYLGIEPAKNIAEKANKEGINTFNDFFSSAVVKKILKNYKYANLIIANNVFAHVPNINDFVIGVKTLLAEDGIFSIEVPYLKDLVEKSEFDTIYHEHYFYYSVTSIARILEANGLVIADILKLKTHGGSLRILIKHKENNSIEISSIVNTYLEEEKKIGIDRVQYFNQFKNNVLNTKFELVKRLIELKLGGKSIIGYGAPGKGNTLLNYCGIKHDLLDYTVDKNPIKQNTYLPGSRIPVFSLDKICETKPDYILILPWNLKNEIISDLHYVKEWGAKFIIPIPKFEII